MDEKVKFLPRKDILSLEELYMVAKTFINCGIKKIRLTGGEPLVRKDIRTLVNLLGNHIKSGDLDELTLTTNGSQLSSHSEMLADNGVKRINVSLDSLDADKFHRITRRGNLNQVLDGIQAAKKAGIKIKINMVVMGNENQNDLLPILNYCVDNDFDLTLIEPMPMAADGADRRNQYVPLAQCIDEISSHFDLIYTNHKTSGPAKYKIISGTKTRIGLITPLSQNFCTGCNRIRLTCTGQLYPCLGHDTHLDFKDEIRNGASEADLILSLRNIISQKPAAHDFSISENGISSSTMRSMNTTGG